MNVYDFDQTVYYPDSSYHFFLWCLKRYPAAVLPVIPKSLLLALQYKRGKIGAKVLKQQLFSFLNRLEDVDREVKDFWNSHRQNMQDWYMEQKRDDDLIISASPEFLLAPIAEELGVRLIATKMDPHTGKILGENCHDSEKVLRFRVEYPGETIDEFYSDSLSDTPRAELADRSFRVKKESMTPWPK